MLIRMTFLMAAVLFWTGPAVGQSPIAWYEFENNLNDSSGNGYTGTVAGGAPSYSAGRAGHGQAVYVSREDSIKWSGLPAPPAVTVSLWVKLDANSPPERPWLLDQLRSSSGNWSGWQLKPEKLTSNTAQVRWVFADDHGARPTSYGPANTLFDGQWHHVVGTHDAGTTATVYFDGVKVGQSNSSLFQPAPAGTIMTLNNLAQGGIYGGQIDDIAIWNRVLNPAEVADLSTDMCMHVAPGPVNRYYVNGSGGSVAPAVFTLTNTGNSGLTYTVQEVVNQSWLTLNKAGGGPLNYLATDTVTATIDPTGLAVGRYTCDIRFADNCSPAEEIVLRVSLSVETNTKPPFVISYYDNSWMSLPATTVGYSTLAACGLNVVNMSVQKPPPIDLDLAQQYGLWGMVDWDPAGTIVIPADTAFIDSRAQGLVDQYSSFPALLGYRLRDEPPADEWPQIGRLTQKLLEYDPTCLPWVNILPNYSYGSYGTGITSHKQYIDSYMTTVQPKVLCYDDYTAAYNHTYPPDVYPIYWHYSNSERFREYGLAYHLPYWRIIESNLLNQSPNTEGIFRFQIYSSLAYGFTGILYFTYTQQSETDYAFVYYQNQMGEWGTPTSDGRYYVAQAIHNELAKLSPILSNLTSSNVRFNTRPVFPGYTYVPAEDIETFLSLSGSSYVQGITGGTMVVGEFADASSRRYLMFVNEDWVGGHTFTITLKSANVPGLGKVRKETGRLNIATTPGGVLTKFFGAGDGELYKILQDATDPSIPTGLVGTAQCSTQLFLDWANSSDAQTGIAYYVVYRNGAEIATHPTSSDYTDAGLQANTSYQYRVSAVNGEGVESAQSSPISVTTPSATPDVPSNVHAAPTTVCQGTCSTLSATPGTGGDTVEWFTDSCGGTPVPGGATPSVCPLVTTTYYARTANAGLGCVSPSCASVTVTVNAGTAVLPDLDGDCDVDWRDFAVLETCLSGPNTPYPDGCSDKDFDGDQDVDQSDFGIFQRCYSGEGNPANPNCAS